MAIVENPTGVPTPPVQEPTQVSRTTLLELIPPGSEAHKQLVGHITRRIDASETKINQYYKDWIRAENTYFAYINRDSKTRAASEANDLGRAPEVVDTVIPYANAAIGTIMGYFLSTFCGREHTFTLKGYGASDIRNASNMEKMLQIELEQTQYVEKLDLFFQDSLVYGFGAMKTLWETKTYPKIESVGGQRVKVDVPYHEGTTLENIDPYKFFPDPRVPVNKVAKHGEYVFWRELRHKYELREAEAQGQLKYVDQISGSAIAALSNENSNGLSTRNQRWGTNNIENDNDLKGMVTLHQGTITLDPSDFGLSGDGLRTQKYLVTIANRTTIIQFEPYEAWHGMHPVVVAEPRRQGYEFMSPGVVEYIADYQQLLSWVVNSRMFNVRHSLQGTVIIDPTRINGKDMADNRPGKTIRLLAPGQGNPIDEAIKAFHAPDVTANYTADLRNLGFLADDACAVNDVLRGADTAGEQTATEVNAKLTNASNRLAATARVISSQAFSLLAEQMISNRQQYMTIPVEIDDGGTILGVTDFNGAFRFIVHDGTLPQVRQQEVNTLQEFLQTAINLPEIANGYDMRAVLEEIAKMRGIDLRAYRLSDEEMKQRMDEQAARENPPDGGGEDQIAKLQAELQKSREEHQAKLAEIQAKGQIDAQLQAEKQRHETELARIEATQKTLDIVTKAGIERDKVTAAMLQQGGNTGPGTAPPAKVNPIGGTTKLAERLRGQGE